MKFTTALAFLASMGSVRPALARESAASGVVSIGLPSCAAAPFDTKQLLQVLAVELTPHQLRPEVQADVPKVAAARVELAVASCAPSNDRVTLQIWDVQRKLFVQRSVSLRAVASSARARTLALVITDALHPPSLPLVPYDPPSAPAEPDDSPSVPTESRGPAASAALTTPPDEPERDPLFETSDPYSTPRRLRVGATVHARFANHRQNTLLGLEANAHGPLWAGIEWAIEGSYSEGELLSSLEMAWLNGALGVDIVTAGKPSFGIGPRLSFAHVSSQVAEGLGLVEPFQSVFLTLLGARAGLSGRVGESSLLEVMLEAAHTVSTVPVSEVSRGDGTLPFPSQGWIVTLGLGLAFQN
jgi:hypothetical protein